MKTPCYPPSSASDTNRNWVVILKSQPVLMAQKWTFPNISALCFLSKAPPGATLVAGQGSWGLEGAVAYRFHQALHRGRLQHQRVEHVIILLPHVQKHCKRREDQCDWRPGGLLPDTWAFPDIACSDSRLAPIGCRRSAACTHA